MKKTPLIDVAERFLVIDPGNDHSAWLTYDRSGKIWGFGKESNDIVLGRLQAAKIQKLQRLVIEVPQPRGQLASWQLFYTCIWVGRFIQVWHPQPVHHIDRLRVKMHICGNARAKDKNIRAALIDRWGGQDQAVGKKKMPGPLYGISADIWQALGLAVTFVEGGA